MCDMGGERYHMIYCQLKCQDIFFYLRLMQLMRLKKSEQN